MHRDAPSVGGVAFGTSAPTAPRAALASSTVASSPGFSVAATLLRPAATARRWRRRSGSTLAGRRARSVGGPGGQRQDARALVPSRRCVPSGGPQPSAGAAHVVGLAEAQQARGRRIPRRRRWRARTPGAGWKVARQPARRSARRKNSCWKPSSIQPQRRMQRTDSASSLGPHGKGTGGCGPGTMGSPQNTTRPPGRRRSCNRASSRSKSQAWWKDSKNTMRSKRSPAKPSPKGADLERHRAGRALRAWARAMATEAGSMSTP